MTARSSFCLSTRQGSDSRPYSAGKEGLAAALIIGIYPYQCGSEALHDKTGPDPTEPVLPCDVVTCRSWTTTSRISLDNSIAGALETAWKERGGYID